MKSALLAVFFAVPTFSPEAQLNFALGTILADKFVVGRIYELEQTDADNPFAAYEAKIATSRGVLEVYANDEDVLSVGDDDALLLTYKIRDKDSVMLHQFPSYGVAPDFITLESAERIKSAALSVAKDFGSSSTSCSAEVSDALSALNGSDIDKAINTLWTRSPLSKEDFICVVNEIGSKAAVASRSFSFPPPGFEGVYYHGYKTKGELIAGILPAIMDMNIVPHRKVLSEQDRGRLIAAWLFWGASRKWPYER